MPRPPEGIPFAAARTASTTAGAGKDLEGALL